MVKEGPRVNNQSERTSSKPGKGRQKKEPRVNPKKGKWGQGEFRKGMGRNRISWENLKAKLRN